MALVAEHPGVAAATTTSFGDGGTRYQAGPRSRQMTGIGDLPPILRAATSKPAAAESRDDSIQSQPTPMSDEDWHTAGRVSERVMESRRASAVHAR